MVRSLIWFLKIWYRIYSEILCGKKRHIGSIHINLERSQKHKNKPKKKKKKHIAERYYDSVYLC